MSTTQIQAITTAAIMIPITEFCASRTAAAFLELGGAVGRAVGRTK